MQAAPSKTRILVLLANLLFGGMPSLAFFYWVERNCTLPLDKLNIPWPFFQFSNLPLLLILAWNSLLFVTFAYLHTSLAQPDAQHSLQKVFPPQTIRTIYMMVTGFSAVWMMGAWQQTEITLWSLPFSEGSLDIASVVIYMAFMTGSAMAVIRFDPLSFIGVKQIFQKSSEIGHTEGSNELLTNGVYSYVRHPMYTFTMCAFLTAPKMTLDRFWLVVLSLSYLYVGIPIEERKLVTIFGEAYKRYRQQVPAIFPIKLTESSQKIV